MEFKGTKGKWELDPHDRTIIRSTNSDNGNIAECHAPNNLCKDIAYVQDGTHWGDYEEIAKSNAQLIAAAPEMLNFMNEFIELGNEYDWRPEDELNDLYVKAMDIVNKALGKEAYNE